MDVHLCTCMGTHVNVHIMYMYKCIYLCYKYIYLCLSGHVREFIKNQRLQDSGVAVESSSLQ